VDVLGRRIGRAAVGDTLLVLAAAVVVLLGSPRAARLQVPPRAPLDLTAYVLLVIAVGGLALCRRRPLATLTVTVGATTVYLGLGYPYGPVLFTMGIGTYAVASRLPLVRSLTACLIALAVALLAVVSTGLARPTPHAAGWIAAWSGWLLVPWTAGTVLRLRREAGARAGAEAVQRSAYEERLRIAREVHDVVGHGLAVINMQAGVALHVLDRRPEQARLALAAVKQTSKDALDQLRVTLAVFREPAAGPGGEPNRQPRPGLGQLDALVGSMREAGLPVDLVRTGDQVELPAVVDHAAYRIVQESLTNVLRHATPAQARVWLSYQPDGIIVKITDDGPPAAAAKPAGVGPVAAGAAGGVGAVGAVGVGHGITGMRERAAAVGGELTAGPLPRRGFQVTARLPLGERRRP
jgi:signal transduction histidine kinase